MSVSRKLLAAVSILFAAGAAQALETAPYSPAALAAAQQAGAPVAVHFHAGWCSTCRLQEKALESLRSDPHLDLTVLVADFDQERELKARLGIRAQSTIVVFRGTRETTRLLGQTSPQAIRAALNTALETGSR